MVTRAPRLLGRADGLTIVRRELAAVRRRGPDGRTLAPPGRLGGVFWAPNVGDLGLLAKVFRQPVPGRADCSESPNWSG